MAGKQGGKNKKYGRNSRNASGKNQAARTAKNKDRHIRANPKGHGHVPDKHHKRQENALKIPMDDHVRRQWAPFYEVSLMGTVIEWSSRFSDAQTAWARSHHEATQVFKIDGFGQKLPINMRANGQERKAA